MPDIAAHRSPSGVSLYVGAPVAAGIPFRPNVLEYTLLEQEVPISYPELPVRVNREHMSSIGGLVSGEHVIMVGPGITLFLDATGDEAIDDAIHDSWITTQSTPQPRRRAPEPPPSLEREIDQFEGSLRKYADQHHIDLDALLEGASRYFDTSQPPQRRIQSLTPDQMRQLVDDDAAALD